MSCSCDDYYYYYKVLTTRSADWQTHSILVINVDTVSLILECKFCLMHDISNPFDFHKTDV